MTHYHPFEPAWWLPGGHLQTIWPSLRRRKLHLELKRERLYLPDGDFLDLDWTVSKTEGPIVIILHGLEGSIRSSYAKGILQALTNAGFRAVFMHYRGCSGEHNTTTRAYHAGETADFGFLVQTLRSRFPSTHLSAVGFSLGGNVLLKYLGETKTDNPLDSAVAISVPFLLDKCADRIQQGFSVVYQEYLLSQLRKKMVDKNKYVPLPISLENINQIKNFWEFDNKITARLHGFHDAAEYYEKSSSFYYLQGIKKPTLIIHARNDPFVHPIAIPSPSQLPAHVQLELYESGGHVGFISGGVPWQPTYWIEKRVPEYLSSCSSA